MIHKINSKKTFRPFIFSFIILAFGFFTASAQDISVFLESIDNFSGNPLKAEFRVTSNNTGNAYTIKDVEGLKFFELKKGDEVQIKVILEGYYTEDKTLFYNDLTSDEEQITFKLKQRPIAKLSLSAIEPDRRRKQPAEFEVYLVGKLIGKGNTTKNADVFTLVLTEGGEYTIKAKGEGFDQNTYTQNVEVSTPANQINREVELMKSAPEIMVSFVDEQYGKPVQNTILVLDKNSNEIIYQGSPANGMFKASFKPNVEYLISARASGYKDFDRDVKGPVLENLEFKMRPVSNVQFEILAASNKKPIPAQINLISPSGNEIVVLEEKSFLPTEKGNYKVEVTSPGFMMKNGTIMVNSFSGGVINFTFELEEADQQYKIKVIDHYSREVLSGVDFKVFSQGGFQLKGLKEDNNNSWNFVTDNESKYFIEVSEEGYSDFTMNLKEKKVFDVELFWRPELTYTLYLKDELTKSIVANADLTILDSKGKKVFVYKTEDPGKYLARMNKNEPYSYLISSGNYEENIASLSNEGGNIQNLFLKKKGVKQLAIEFIDEVTKEVILPDYKVGLNGKPVTVVNDNLVLDPDATYSLRALLKNYKSLKIDQLEKLAKGAKVTLEMTRETYPVKIYVKNFESLAELKKIKLSIFTTKNVSVLNRLDDRGNFFETFVQADGSYKLTAKTEGYEIFTKDFQLTELVKENAKDITLTIVLKENNKPEVVVKEIPKIEADPIIEAPKPVVINKPELEEKVVLNSVPSNVASLEKELTDKNSIGKRYFLDQVNFNQSSPKITDEIVKQLDNIAKVLQDKPQVKIEIVGHTDNVGDPRANLGLSRFRAKAVGNYLFNKGADPDRIIVIGKGEEEPVASNDTEENRAKNRRVEMILIEN